MLWVWGCCGGGGDVLVGGEVGDDGLDVLEGFFEDLADVGAGVAAGVDELAPFLGLEADGAEPVEERDVGLGVVAVDDHDGFAVGGEGGGLAGVGACGETQPFVGWGDQEVFAASRRCCRDATNVDIPLLFG